MPYDEALHRHGGKSVPCSRLRDVDIGVNTAVFLHSMCVNLFLHGSGQLTVISRPWGWVGAGDFD